MVLVIKSYMHIQCIILLLICGLLVSCQPQSSIINKSSMEEKVVSYLQAKNKAEILDLKITKQVNTANLTNKKKPYIAKYTSEELAYRSAAMMFYDEKEMLVDYDTYSEEIVCLNSDSKIEEEGGDIPFVIYSKLTTGRAEKVDWSLDNYPLDELQAKIFEGAEFQILVLVIAPDIIEDKRKYEVFHIELMRRLKAQGVENGSLEMIFLDEEIDLESSRTSPRAVIAAGNPIKEHTLQRWVSIHKIKWYDMVKDHPDKVLKYGSIYEK